ncbi:MAG: bifunctional YncE family protein/alkaline phosphatase family protein [Zavarzinella sp.]
MKIALICATLALLSGWGLCEEPKVGPDGPGIVITTGQLIRPAGDVVAFPGRPVDLVYNAPFSEVIAKDNRGLVVVDANTWKLKQEIPFPKGKGGASMHGITISKSGTTVYATTSSNLLQTALRKNDGTWVMLDSFEVYVPRPEPKKCDEKTQQPIPKNTYPTGVVLNQDETKAYVCLSRENAIAIVDLRIKEVVGAIPVGVAPHSILLSADEKTLYVSNWGGRHPRKGERSAPSAGTPTLIDERGIAVSGTIGICDIGQAKMTTEIAVGLHPAGLVLSPDRHRLCVANANSDTISVIDLNNSKVSHTLTVRPDSRLPFGSGTNALCFSPDGKLLFAANGGNNAVAMIEVNFALPEPLKVMGYIPAGWFPGAVTVSGNNLMIANIKGEGSRTPVKKKEGFNSHGHRGTLSRVRIPDAATLAKYTKQVLEDARIPQALAAMEKARADMPPVPVPARIGEPSVFEHIVYIIKENRTYDQVYGELKQGNGEPKFCIYGRNITPNHHALAEQFVLLDNYYCNGVLSADGHSWLTEGNVTDHLEKAFGGFTRSYTYGDDPLTYSSSGFIWDNALLRGKTVRNYGELVDSVILKDKDAKQAPGFKEIYDDFQAKKGAIRYNHKLGIEHLKKYTAPDYPGWNMKIPDVVRAAEFMKEFEESKKKKEWYNLVMIYLPQDHASGLSPGMPKPQAHMADNDLALGQVVEAITKSPFWPKTCIFVIEDDPQDGWDHVDGHRSVCMVISPYTKRNAVVSKFYNQTSVIHTMERMLGCPPMNQFDSLSPVMTDCFTTKPDFTPYTCLPVSIKLDDLNPPRKKNMPTRLQELIDLSLKQDFTLPDRVNDDQMNRILWHAMKGIETPYPADFAGAHGKGFRKAGLLRDPRYQEDDDDE